MTEFVGVQRRALVDDLVERLDALCAGENVPAVVVLEAELGAGKSRIVREFYERLRQRETEDGPQYWPPLEEPRRQMPVKADPLPMRKVIGPPLNGFRWAPDAVPAFGWWDLACQQLRSGEMTAVTRDFEEWQRVHGPAMWWAWNTRAGNWERVRSKRDEIVNQAREVLAEGQMHALEQMAEAFDLPSIGLGWAIARAWDMWEYAGARKQRREALAGDVTFDADPTTRSLEIASLLRQTARPDLPLVLAIEDAHEMGEDLAALFGALAQPSPDHPVLVIATAWPEGRTKETWNLWLTAAAAQQRAEVLSVAPLTTNERLEIVEAFAPSTESELAEAVAQHWEQPLALELLLTWERVALHIAENNGALQYSAQELADFPTEIQSLFERRWQDLPPALKKALAVARIGLPEETGTEPFIASLVADAAQQLDQELEAEIVLAQFNQAREFRWIVDSPFGDAFVETTLAAVVWDDLANVLGRDWRESCLPRARDELIRGLAARINAWRGDGYLLVDSHLAPDATASEVNTMASWLLALRESDEGQASDSVAVAEAVAAVHLSETAAANYEYGKAITWVSQVLDRFPAEHPYTLATHSDLAGWLGECGRIEQAIATYRELLPKQTRILGPDHPQTLTTRNNLAYWLGESGRAEDATAACEELLADQVRILGPQHPLTLTTRNNLAHLYGESGQLERAIGALRGLVKDRARIQGPEHPLTFATRSNLAASFAKSGNLELAIDLYEELAAAQAQALGETHPDTLTTKNNLGFCLAEVGRVADAASLLGAVHAQRIHMLGRTHPATLLTDLNRTVCMVRTGDYMEAIPAFVTLLDAVSGIQGSDHILALAVRGWLAHCYAHTGRVEDAILIQEATSADCTRALGASHPDTLTSRASLADLFALAGDTGRSIACYEILLPEATTALGPTHPDVLTMRHNLATYLARAGHLEQAKTQFEALLADQAYILSPDHPQTLITRRKLEDLRHEHAGPTHGH